MTKQPSPPCSRCDGTGLVCDACDKPSTACTCERPRLRECERCGGLGE